MKELIVREPRIRQLFRFFTLSLFAFTLAGCGLFGGTSQSTEPVATRVPVPTFTATPPPPPTKAEPPTPAPTDTTVAPTDTPEQPTPLPTPATPQIQIVEALANVRGGPGTEYGITGKINQNERYDVLAKDPTAQWWKICCVNGQQGWVFAPLVKAENVENVAVDTNIPPPPVAEVPTPIPPTAVPPTQPPPPPAAPDPCAGIGGDGCKFKIRSGPTFGGNNGSELKLQFFFIHSGVEGGQPQGSYFVAMFKDGQKLPIPDSVRSIALEKRGCSLGTCNYETTLQLSQIPGGNVAGNYSLYVLDGNGERDSKDFSFSIPDGQGQVYIVFDQR